MKKQAIFIFFIILLTGAFATTIYIPEDYTTIQEGISASEDGDEIIVSPGTYLENINFAGKAIILGSLFYTTQDSSYIEQTIIDGNQNGSVITFASGENSASVLIGFTITNGLGDEDGGGIYCDDASPGLVNLMITSNSTSDFNDGYGGGIYCCNSSSPSLENVTIIDNYALSCGGGIFCQSSSPSFENVAIIDNFAWYGGGVYFDDSALSFANVTITDNTSGYNGGGICCESSSASFENVTITDNTGGYSSGGGIFCNESSMSFENVQFTGNSVEDRGGGICFSSSSADLEGVTFAGNSVEERGAGIHFDNSIATLINVTFTGNSAYYTFHGFGGGIYCCNYSNLDLVNVTFIDNIAHYNGGGICCEETAQLSFVNGTITNNSARFGGGFYCIDSSPSLEDITITDNSAEVKGGGIYCNQGSLSLENVMITNNSAAEDGGGIYYNFCSPNLLNVSIMDNSVETNGGGIYCFHSNPSFENVMIGNNSAGFGGGGIFYENSSSTNLVNVTISGNSAEFFGGGIYCNQSSPIIENVTITDNVADIDGGGIYCYTSNPIVVNSIVWNNLPQDIVLSAYSYLSSVTIAYSDISGGEEGIETNENGTANWLEGNIDIDPFFMDVLVGDYHLTEYSPCIDTGTSYFEYDGEVLVDLSQYEYSGIAPDMGAFEYGLMLLYGDIDDNELVESLDASLVLMYVVGLDPLPELDPRPWSDWRVEKADVNLSGDIGAIDAAHILQYIVGLISQLPVVNAMRLPPGEITISHDAEYIYLNSLNPIFSLEYELTSAENLTVDLQEVINDDCLYNYNDNKFALISAAGIAGNIVRIPYQAENPEAWNIHFQIEDNGNSYDLEYLPEDNITELDKLISIYPNPFNPETQITFNLPEAEQVNISVYNLKGQLVKILTNEILPSGNNTLIWDGRNTTGRKVSSGVYLLRLKSSNGIVSKKIMLIK
ncbi:MAG: T9SS type A sorting domain-containing protein [Candidatus Cloacimonetes bacterium]|nr:T9SS type A sorting domain-containing protein [Candidatus Cloacimonadota bacterium]